MNNLPSYDFLGAVYEKSTLDELEICLHSISNQTIKPNKVVLVIDGPLQFDLKKTLDKYNKLINIILVKITKNMGLGIALRKGLKFCSSEYILRFDTDDYNIPSRAEEQLTFMLNKNLDISSSNVFEFIINPDNPVSFKNIPLTNNRIKMLLPFRNPFNHPSICFKLSSIKKVDGGYRDFPFYEDYDLWIRAISRNLRCGNLKRRLVGMKVDELINRRKGMGMILHEAKLIKTFWDYSSKNLLLFIPTFFLRSVVRLMPKYFINFLYKKILRSKNNIK